MAPKRRKKQRKPARSGTYSIKIVEAICEEIATSERGLDAICKSRKDWPNASTFYRWLDDPDERFQPAREMYARARERQGEFMASKILAIADDGQNDTYVDAEGNERVNYDHIQRSKLRVDARKFLAAKLAPRIYGERKAHEHSGPDGGPIPVQSFADLAKSARDGD